MSRRPVVLFASLACVTAVVACGGDDESSATTTEGRTVATVVGDGELDIVVESDLVYLTDDEGEP